MNKDKENQKIVKYNTRDEKGNDIVKDVIIKEFPVIKENFDCKICGKNCNEGCRIKDIVSSNFTDWVYVGNMVCEDCSNLFSLYFYSYIVENGDISIINIRELRDNILRTHRSPFRFVITKSCKKHLFYKCPVNLSDESFAIQLENETIYTNRLRMKYLFDFVENLMTLGQSKQQMELGNINYDILAADYGQDVFIKLHEELLMSREIQIPLFCGQKRNISKEEAICNLTLLLRT